MYWAKKHELFTKSICLHTPGWMMMVLTLTASRKSKMFSFLGQWNTVNIPVLLLEFTQSLIAQEVPLNTFVHSNWCIHIWVHAPDLLCSIRWFSPAEIVRCVPCCANFYHLVGVCSFARVFTFPASHERAEISLAKTMKLMPQALLINIVSRFPHKYSFPFSTKRHDCFMFKEGWTCLKMSEQMQNKNKKTLWKK